MFLRGLPNLCIRMKRPPKVKHAAAAARLESGAGFGVPNFNRISKIAPLPQPTFHFKPVLRNTKDFMKIEESTINQNDNEKSSKPQSQVAIDIIITSATRDVARIKPEPLYFGNNEPDEELSKSDLIYLRHQNKLLLQHGGFTL